MKATFRFCALSTSILLLLPFSAIAQPASPRKVIQPGPPAPAKSSPPPLFSLTVKSPGGNENWEIGKSHAISWTSSNVRGDVRLDLYRGGTDPRHKVGTITAGTPVSNGRYAWEAGKHRAEEPAAPGTGYRIAIKADSPSMTRFSAPFSLVPASGIAIVASPAARATTKDLSSVKLLVLTYPRRADLLHKGIKYKLAWKSTNLANARLKIELLNGTKTQVIVKIAENAENSGELFWVVPMSLPDEKTLYSVRIQTMDGAMEDTVDSVRIAKGPVPSGPPSLKVTNPAWGDRYIGDTVPVKWSSYSNCSTLDEGPISDVFRIDLMNEDGTAQLKELTDMAYGYHSFDSEGPSGILNWHWDWTSELGGTYQGGTYRIRVSNYDGKCSGTGEAFRLMYPRKRLELPPESFHITIFQDPGTLEEHNSSVLEWQMSKLGCTGSCYPVHEPVVGEHYGWWSKWDGGEGLAEDATEHKELFGYVLRTRIDFHVFDKKPAGTIKQVRLHFDRTWKAQGAEIEPCLRGFGFAEGPSRPPTYTHSDPPPLSGTIPVNSAQGDTIDVGITQQYLDQVARTGNYDLQIVLYTDETRPPMSMDVPMAPNCGEGYKVKLVVDVESNVHGMY